MAGASLANSSALHVACFPAVKNGKSNRASDLKGGSEGDDFSLVVMEGLPEGSAHHVLVDVRDIFLIGLPHWSEVGHKSRWRPGNALHLTNLFMAFIFCTNTSMMKSFGSCG